MITYCCYCYITFKGPQPEKLEDCDGPGPVPGAKIMAEWMKMQSPKFVPLIYNIYAYICIQYTIYNIQYTCIIVYIYLDLHGCFNFSRFRKSRNFSSWCHKSAADGKNCRQPRRHWVTQNTTASQFVPLNQKDNGQQHSSSFSCLIAINIPIWVYNDDWDGQCCRSMGCPLLKHIQVVYLIDGVGSQSLNPNPTSTALSHRTLRSMTSHFCRAAQITGWSFGISTSFVVSWIVGTPIWPLSSRAEEHVTKQSELTLYELVLKFFPLCLHSFHIRTAANLGRGKHLCFVVPSIHQVSHGRSGGT